MLDALPILLALTCNAVDVKVLINDVETVSRERCDNTQLQNDITPWLIPGRNTVELLVRPAWGAGPAPQAPQLAPRAGVEPNIPSAVLMDQPLKTALALRSISVLQSGRYSTTDRMMFLVRSDFPIPAWARADRINLSPQTEKDINTFLKQAADILTRGNQDEVQDLLSFRLQRAALANKDSASRFATAAVANVTAEANRGTWKVTALPIGDGAELTLHGRGRIARVAAPGGSPALLGYRDSELITSWPVEVARIGGKWVLL